MGSFTQWYETNKEEFNSQRQVRYKTDKEYRDKQRGYARLWRKRHAHIVKPKPKKTLWSISELASGIGCSVEVLRVYERQGLIPSASVDGKHRRYTAKQIELVRVLFEYRQATNYHELGYKKELDKIVAGIKKEW